MEKTALRLTRALRAWGTVRFEAALKDEVERLSAEQLPLQQGLSLSSHVTDSPRQLLIFNVAETEGSIQVKTGMFFSGIIAGCSCADDPTPISEQNEFCIMQIDIDKQTANATVTLVKDDENV